MTQLIVHNLTDAARVALERIASDRGATVEEVAGEILSDAAVSEQPNEIGLGTRIASRFEGIGFDEPVKEWRGSPVTPPDFSE